MSSGVKQTFDTICSNVVFDKKLLKRIKAFQVGFVNKNPDHIAFFGGHLTGVHSVRFTNADYYRWFDEILETDERDLREQLHALDSINKDWKVSSNVLYLSCLWLAHRILNSPSLREKEKEDGIIDVLLVLNFRFLTWLYKKYFPFPANKEVAEAAYAELSMKFRLKVDGNWMNSLQHRAMDIFTGYQELFKKLDDDEAIISCLNDSQGRINDRLKNITTVFREVHAQGKRMKSLSDVVGFDGEDILRDKASSVSLYKQYILSTLIDKKTFIKEEIIDVILKILKTVPEKHFRMTLEWLVSHYERAKGEKIEFAIDELLTHSFTYLSRNRSLVTGSVDLVSLLSNLRGIYTSSRTKDQVLVDLRQQFEDISEQATSVHNKNTLAAIRTAVMMYIITRAYTKNHYS